MPEDLLIKNNWILELEAEKSRKFRNGSRISDLATRAAEAEGRIAADLLSKGRQREAVVDANKVKEAREVFERAIALASDARVQEFIRYEIEGLAVEPLEPVQLLVE